MICPFCGVNMSEGFVHNRGEALCWVPIGEKRGWSFFSTSPHAVEFAKFSIFTGAKKTAFFCKQCKKVLIDVK